MVTPSILSKVTDEKTWVVQFKGPLTEDSVLPALPQDAKRVLISLKELDFINSAGIRTWLRWTANLKEQQPSVPLEITDAPLAFLRLVASIITAIPDNAQLSSFQVSFGCLDCGKLNHVKVPNSAGEIKRVCQAGTPPNCGSCGSETELELSVEFYEGLLQYSPDVKNSAAAAFRKASGA